MAGFTSRSFFLLFLFSVVFFSNVVSLGPAQPTKPCHMDKGQTCEVDEYVGSKVIYEDDRVRVWNFTLAPGEMTSMHRHDHDYYFVAINPTQLEVWGENGTVLFDFRAEGTIGFKIDGEILLPVSNKVQLPWVVPRVHAAKNIGPEPYYEILFETKTTRKPAGNDDEIIAGTILTTFSSIEL